MSKLNPPDFCWAFIREDYLRNESLAVLTFPHGISESVIVIVKNGEVVSAYQEKGSAPRLGKPLMSPPSTLFPILEQAAEVAEIVVRNGHHPKYTDIIAVPFKPLNPSNGIRDVFLYDPKTGAQLEIILDNEDEPVNINEFPPRYAHSPEMSKEYRDLLHQSLQNGEFTHPSDKMRELLENYHLLLG